MAAKKKWTFENTRAGYTKMWGAITIKAGDLANAGRFAKMIEAGKSEYLAVQEAIGVPWFFVGALHMRESSCNFSGVLHNGEHIIGTKKKTRLVPAGRGPFADWHTAAIDALKLKGFDKISEWSAARMGYEGERFNGLGYIGKGVNSAYLWAGSNHEQLGKYVADHKWDAKFDDPQIGVMTVLAALCNRNPDIAKFMKSPASVVEVLPTPIATVETAPAPVTSSKPGIFGTLWRMVRGKDAAIDTSTAKARPGLHADGDAALWDQQDMLSRKGYTEVGSPDGLMGDRTVNAIRAFRSENGLPAGDTIDAKFAAALAAAGQRQIAKSRVEATATDLREKGNTQVNLLDNFGWVGKLILGGGVLGGVSDSGVLDKATGTLQSVQDTLGTVTTILTTIIGVAQWCFSHWWIFAVGGGGYLVFRAAMGVLNMVVLFRQGFLNRADR